MIPRYCRAEKHIPTKSISVYIKVFCMDVDMDFVFSSLKKQKKNPAKFILKKDSIFQKTTGKIYLEKRFYISENFCM